MAITQALKITDIQDLRKESQNFKQHAEELKQTTQQMMQNVQSSIDVWHGDAQKSFTDKFQQLQKPMNSLFEDCMEYSNKVNEVAKQYAETEQMNTAEVNQLANDISLV